MHTSNNSLEELNSSQKANLEHNYSKQSPNLTANELVSLDD